MAASPRDQRAPLTIREVRPEDYHTLIDFWRTQPGVHLNDADAEPAMTRYLERNPGLSFLAENSSGIKATALAGHDGRRGYLFHVAVHESCRGQGLAKEILNRCYAGLAKCGIAKCYLFILPENESGMQFWSAQGWKSVDEFKVYSRML